MKSLGLKKMNLYSAFFRYLASLFVGTFGVLWMVPMVILPVVPLAAIGCYWYRWQSKISKQILTVISNVSAGCKQRK